MIRFDNDDIRYLAVELPYRVKCCKYASDFTGEIGEIDNLLAAGGLPSALEKRLIIERVIADGMKHDYKTDFAGLLEKVQKKYPACGERELCEIIRMGQVDYICRGAYGTMYFQNAAVSNIFNCHAKYLKRLTDPEATLSTAGDDEKTENIRIMKKNGFRAFRFTVEESLSPDENCRRDGAHIRVHLPYPAPCQSQPEGQIKLLGSSHEVYISNAEQRTAFIDATYHAGDTYSVKFSYVNRAEYKAPEVSAVSAEQPDFCTGELYPHIRFTPFICELACEIAGQEKNPLILARRVYDWVTEHVKYSYMREYLYLDNIPEFAALNGRGDCGVMAILFITLCRRLGIPARWESGSCIKPGSIGSHDWAQFYIAPYGWLYADPSYGGGALHRGNTELWNHYFGNLDPFRLVANTELQQSFDPPKRFMRTDPYDNQSGEAEYNDYGLGFDDMDKNRSVIAAEEL